MNQFLFFTLLAFTSIAHADILSRNLTVNSKNITVVENYSAEKEFGLINITTCDACPVIALTLSAKSIFILDNKNQPAENLSRTRLTRPSKAVRIQYNYQENSVAYIRWNPVSEY